MQSLSYATNSRRGSAESLRCAKALMDCLPGVMWFIRRQLRKNSAGGLSLPQFRSLAFLERFPCATLSALSVQLGSTLPTASRMVSGLVRKKMIRRKGGTKDRRKLALELTPLGKRTLATINGGTTRGLASALANVSDRELSEITSALMALERTFTGPTGETCPDEKNSRRRRR